MLNRLSIQNYALIDSLDISFAAGLNIITGETGAGKSILLGALSLILGQRAETKYFFNQGKKCIIEGYFKIEEVELKSFFEENDLDYEAETILRREISSDGRSRAFINDTPVNLQTLRQLGERLIDIHSQHATLEINDENFQRLVVDTIAMNSSVLSDYLDKYKSFRKKLSELDRLKAESAKAKTDADYYQFQFDELEKASLKEGEQESIETELNSQNHAEEIKRNLLESIDLLSDGQNAAISQLKIVFQNLQQSEKYNPSVAELAERIQSVQIELKDIASEIETIEQSTFFDARRAEELSNRLDIIFTLQKKHNVTSDKELIALRDELSEKLFVIGSSDDKIGKLEKEVSNEKATLILLAKKLSETRKKAIPKIEKLIASSLEKVAMPSTQFVVENNLLADEDFGQNGIDQLKFLFSANKGQSPAPMNKVASGGELSRLMLSIKSLIAKSTTLPTIIFDEIDTGISGETALKVGRVMEELGNDMQVIAITHLPQIASKGQSHYQVYKEQNNSVTKTGIRVLENDERIFELATMLSGHNPGESAIQNAKELLAQ